MKALRGDLCPMTKRVWRTFVCSFIFSGVSAYAKRWQREELSSRPGPRGEKDRRGRGGRGDRDPRHGCSPLQRAADR